MDRYLDIAMRHPEWVILGALALLLALVLRGLRRLAQVAANQRAQAAVLDERLDRDAQAVAQVVAQSQQRVQASVQQGLMSLQGMFDERIGGLQRQLMQDAAALKTDLMQRFEVQQKLLSDALGDARLAQQRESASLREAQDAALARHREGMDKHLHDALKAQQTTLVSGMEGIARQVNDSFKTSSEELGKQVAGLTRTTDERLKEISGQVEKRLSEGFEKTTETFTRVLEHLSRIDEAQKKITELSGNVVSLQEVLTDKRSRGAFGEVQLAGLVENMMPQGSFVLQETLSNGTRVDCMLYLPEPTGKVPIDAKFPLESFQAMLDPDRAGEERARATRQFRADIRKHIHDIADKYLIAGETADGAVLFLPAEAVFAEIHAHFPDLVEEAQRARVWLVSPTTLMAVLTTARAVLKDDATRKQVHVIQDHLRRLSEDFGRFRQRMDKLAVHIRQAHEDVDGVHVSARKISNRFAAVNRVELEDLEDESGVLPEVD